MERDDIILDAAVLVYKQFGLQKANIQDVADKAGVSKKTIYNHFNNRYELFHKAIFREAIRTVEFFNNLLDNQEYCLPEKLVRAVAFATEQFEFNHSAVKKDISQLVNPYLNEAPVCYIQRNIFRAIESLIKEAQEQNLCRRDYSPKALSQILLKMVWGFMSSDGYSDDMAQDTVTVPAAIHLLLQAMLTNEGLKNLPKQMV